MLKKKLKLKKQVNEGKSYKKCYPQKINSIIYKSMLYSKANYIKTTKKFATATLYKIF